MQPSEFIQQVETALLPLADALRAQQMKAYLRNQFEFLGLPAPVRRQAVKSLLKPRYDPDFIFAVAIKLWQRPEREYRYTVVDLLAKNVNALHVEHLPQIKALLQDASWWETADSLASVISDLILTQAEKGVDSQSIMDSWLQDADFWVRRVAMIHQLGWKLKTDTQRLAHYAQTLATEREFFIRKAIGWAFRDYARWNPQWVSRFMREKHTLFSPLTIREATKHL